MERLNGEIQLERDKSIYMRWFDKNHSGFELSPDFPGLNPPRRASIGLGSLLTR